ncbi:hypothetical protein KC902_02510 [Candidatus Kaiserbacteria bacterium]|nr:hypothetical protein [Candidatus Kaiserbacteria bacterium]USN88460.1 MAG: hypothetical protein H6780_03115 [Candidatus Nomurabacteria bacterium]
MSRILSSSSPLLTDLFKAYEDARRHKRKTKGTLEFSLNYEERLFELYEDLVCRRYKIAPATCFIVTKPVRREIFAGDFRDRIVHHLIFNYLNPLCERLFTNDSYACRKGKGTSYGIKRADHFIRSVSHNYTRDCYVLQLDISGYFMSINRTILYEKVTRIIERYRDEITFDTELVLWLLEKIIFHDHIKACIQCGDTSNWTELPSSKSLFHAAPGCGLPIGNLTSQLFGNVYLNDFDHFAMRLVPGVRCGRYVDDMIFVHQDKEVLRQIILKVQYFLSEKLALTLHPRKIKLTHYEQGIDFLGARMFRGRMYPRRPIVTNVERTIMQWNEVLQVNDVLTEAEVQKLLASINASLGHLAFFQTRRLRQCLLARCMPAFLRHVQCDKSFRTLARMW